MSSDKKLLVVLGITGQQGGSVAKVFSDLEPSWRIRGVTRNPSSAASKALLSKYPDIELVAGDLDHISTLDSAFTNADAIFSVTDFWSFLQSNNLQTGQGPVFEAAKRKGVLPNDIAYEQELQQGKNVIDAAAKAHAAKPLHRFVLSTLSATVKWSKGSITRNLHFDAKADYTTYLQSAHPSLASVSSYVQIGFYLSNLWMWPVWTPRKSDKNDNLYIFPTNLSSDHSHPIPYVDPPNDTGHFVRALISSPKSPPGTNLLGYCWNTSSVDYIELWAKTLGVKYDIEYLSTKHLEKGGIPSWLAEEINASGEYVSKFGWDGGEEGVKGPEEAGVELDKLTKVEDWFKAQDWSSIGIAKA